LGSNTSKNKRTVTTSSGSGFSPETTIPAAVVHWVGPPTAPPPGPGTPVIPTPLLPATGGYKLDTSQAVPSPAQGEQIPPQLPAR
jgi:hypothetical protein